MGYLTTLFQMHRLWSRELYECVITFCETGGNWDETAVGLFKSCSPAFAESDWRRQQIHAKLPIKQSVNKSYLISSDQEMPRLSGN